METRIDMTGRTVRFVGVAALVLALAAMAGSHLFAQGPAPEGPPPTPRALTPQSLDLEGYWVSIINEDYRWRMVTPPPGDFASLPLIQAGREMGEQWTPDQGRLVPRVRHGGADADAHARAPHLGER